MADPIRQLLSQTSYDADGVTTVWDFSFAGGYLARTHVKARLRDDDTGEITQLPISDADFLGDFQLSITPPVADGYELTIYRDTPKDLPLVNFADKASLTEAALDENAKQAIFAAAEAEDNLLTAIDSVASIIGYVADAEQSADEAAASAAAAAADAADINTNIGSAATNAAAAAASATAAGNSATAAANSASAASTSATNAGNSATAAAASASAASTSASNAATSATNASTSAGTASSAATTATTAATNAGNSATTASTAATNAGNSATAAAGSATAANTSAVNAAASAASVVSVPVGGVIGMPGTTAPAGFVKYNGALLSRTTYAALWAYAQSSGNLLASDALWTGGAFGAFSPGDGSTTFRIPDGRGEFFRGLDDGRGVDTSRNLKDPQASANLAHTHGTTESAHTHGVSDPTHSHSVAGSMLLYGQFTAVSAVLVQSGSIGTSASATGVSIVGATTGLTVNSNGGTEARPRNHALLWCIKF